MSKTDKDTFLRSRLLLGDTAMERMAQARVAVFGVGGVGSWCAESLVRTGVRHITIVDGDTVCASNINRQLMATQDTVGRPKVEVMRERLLGINHEAEVTALHKVYTADNAADFRLEEYDYVVDAIDSLPDKAHLILTAGACTTLFSSMGAALKTDPTQVGVAEFWKVEGDPLARALRNRFKKQKTFPARKFLCVYSRQQAMKNRVECDGLRANGSLCHITGVFGLALAGLVINSIMAEPPAGE